MNRRNQHYREVLGSDVINDGMYLELWDSSDSIVACVFRSDATGEYEIHLGPALAPREIVDEFVQRAKETLASRNTNLGELGSDR